MDNWVLTGPKALTRQQQTELSVDAGQVKVKITHVMLSNFDALVYDGDIKAHYPKTVGRFAIGVVTETGDKVYGIQKGARVYLEPTRACRKCLACKSGDSDNCEDVQVAGRDYDGFLRDFVVCDYKDVAVLPDEVDDFHALCIENVALAENIFDKLNLSAGSKVAIVGSNFLGCILAQVAMYHKFVPIVIDNYERNLDKLRKCGVYFAFAQDDNLADNIAEATSGSLCDAAVYTSCCKLNPNLAANVLARKKDLVLGGFSTINFKLDSLPLFANSLRVYAVTDGYEYTEAAINMIVHGAIDLDIFDKEVLSEYDPAALLTARLDEIPSSTKMTILKLII